MQLIGSEKFDELAYNGQLMEMVEIRGQGCFSAIFLTLQHKLGVHSYRSVVPFSLVNIDVLCWHLLIGLTIPLLFHYKNTSLC